MLGRGWAVRVVAGLLLAAAWLPLWAGAPLLLRTADVDNNRILFDRADPQLPGLCVEIMRAMEQVDPDLHFKIDTTPLPMARSQAYLANNQLDVLCGLLKTPDRLTRFRFTATPIFYVRHKVAVRANDDVSVTSLDDIRKLGPEGLIMTAQGSAFVEYLRRQGGLRVDAANKDSALMLHWLAGGYARFLYNSEATLRAYIRHEGLQGKVRLLPVVFNEEPSYMAFGRHLSNTELQRLEDVLVQLARQGTLKRLYARYAGE